MKGRLFLFGTDDEFMHEVGTQEYPGSNMV